METSVLSASNMVAVGVTTVFIALALLIAAVSLLSLLLRRSLETAASTAAVATPRTPAEVTKAQPEDDYRLVALAAYAYHLRASVSITQPRSPSPWLRAGRQQQVQRGRGA